MQNVNFMSKNRKEYNREYYLKNKEKYLERSKTKKVLEYNYAYGLKIKQEKKENALLINEQFIKDNNLVEHPTLLGYYGTFDGKVFSNKGSYGLLRELNPTIQKNNNGYSCLTLSVNKKRIQIYHHRFIAEIFLPNPKNFNEINHIDENKLNNSVKNLEWCDRKYNASFSLAKKYLIENIKTGEKYVIENLSDWCKKNKVNRSSVQKVYSGKIKKVKDFVISKCECEFK
jgi:hypothetical protein